MSLFNIYNRNNIILEAISSAKNLYCNAFEDNYINPSAIEALQFYNSNIRRTPTSDNSALGMDASEIFNNTRSKILKSMNLSSYEWDVIFTGNKESACSLAVEIVSRNVDLANAIKASANRKDNKYNIYINKYCDNNMLFSSVRQANFLKRKYTLFDEDIAFDTSKLRVVVMPIIDKSLGLNWWTYFTSKIGAKRFVDQKKPLEYIILDGSNAGEHIFMSKTKTYYNPASAIILSGCDIGGVDMGILVIRKELLKINHFNKPIGTINNIEKLQNNIPCFGENKFVCSYNNTSSVIALSAAIDDLKSQSSKYRNSVEEIIKLKRAIITNSSKSLFEVKHNNRLVKVYNKMSQPSMALNIASHKKDIDSLYKILIESNIICRIHEPNQIPTVTSTKEQLRYVQLSFDHQFLQNKEAIAELISRLYDITLNLHE